MNHKNRKYVRPSRKSATASTSEINDAEFTLSTTAAVGILGGTFLAGLAAGKLIDACRKW
ncbi:hypothetical protein CLHUN_00510 [Ruminiclostridium hungatei]|uniref:Uncharacterized protein n=1 Tax=Ruminiclostridium hungatei TaxID=48256 RepID=A0A1V4SS14_RUMHU|nr:hypothetical protein [Ruminiclostridium hungatei]OPX46235.1 hypothetical protein CLHUN_00510 [Ruminiclostridium hungatei]